MPASSLQSLCRKACIKNVHSLTDVGDFEYDQIADILSFLKSPEQLRLIELNSPQIKGADADLWQKFIAKEVPKWADKNYAPKNPLKWYEVYKRYKKEQAEEIKRDEEILRQTMMGIKKARDNNLSKVVDLGSLPKLPRDPRMIANNGGVPIGRTSHKKENSGLMTFAQGSKTKMKDGKSVLIRARREAKEIAQMGKLSRPTHQLSIGRVTKAPAAMLMEYRTANQPALKILSRKPVPKSAGTESLELEERERRLKALTAKAKVNGKRPHLIDSEDDSEGDDLFDDTPSIPQNKVPLKNRSVRPIQSSKTNTDSKRPSDVISALVSKQNTTPRYVIHSKPSKAGNSSEHTDSISESRSLTSKDIGSQKTPKLKCPSEYSALSKSSPTLKPMVSKPMIVKKRKEVDIFNRNPSKRTRS